MKAIAAKLTTKGQITIPQEVRERLDLHAGDNVIFRLDDEADSAKMHGEGRAASATLVPLSELGALAGSMRPPVRLRRLSWAAIRDAAWEREVATGR